MKLIIPMAGMGKRLRPHTLITPKPLFPIAGKPIVQRLAEDIAAMSGEAINEVAFIIGRFGKEVENRLLHIAESIGASGKIYYQDEALGTGHAIHCARPSLTGPVIVAFADTLFSADFKLDPSHEGVIWVKQIDDPSQFGVVTIDDNGYISGFAEKPKEFVSDLAIIGIYFFRDGDLLRTELDHLIEHGPVKNGEYQLTDTLERMQQAGIKFVPGEVNQWMDCGNKDAVIDTHRAILEKSGNTHIIAENAIVENSTIINPVYIGPGARVENAVIGPFVSLESGASVCNAVVSDAILRENCSVQKASIQNAIVGIHALVNKSGTDLSVGDYSVVK
ncbi:MAG: sugar phosphate nucleotidyltransferase [Salibacteraceae bacterium]